MGLRLRLILVLVTPLVLVVGVYGFSRIREEQAQLLEQDRRGIALTAKAVQIAVENALRDRQISDIKRLLSEIVEDQEQIDRIRLFARTLRPTLVSNPLSIGEEIPRDALRRVIETGQPEGFYQQRDKQSVYFYVVPLRGQKGETQGAMEVVHLAVGVERRGQAAIRDVWLRMGVLLLAVAVLAGLMLQRQVLRPLSRLMEGIRSLGQGRQGPPLPVERRDELGRVAEAFNQMAEQLERARLNLLAETERTLDLERQLRQAETLAVAGKLATALAHEVGTPLNIISGRAEFLLQALPADAPGRQDLEVIVAQIDRISGIIRSLLDMVRPQKPQVQPTRLDSVLERLLPLLQHTARRRGVVLTTAVPADLPPMLADPNQLQQVLINLLINALEATPAGGRVSVDARATTHDGRAGVAVSVTDTGPGIPPDLLPRVFEPFFTTKPPGQGTGLGLAISRDIVQAHGGQIRVESRDGAGTTFVAWLPGSEGGQP
jgi:two-component system, NtrC family, sensor kinase